jgi:hypothetical protein
MDVGNKNIFRDKLDVKKIEPSLKSKVGQKV